MLVYMYTPTYVHTSGAITVDGSSVALATPTDALHSTVLLENVLAYVCIHNYVSVCLNVRIPSCSAHCTYDLQSHHVVLHMYV